MKFPGFVGPAYTLMSRNADGEECINYYLEVVGSEGHTKAPTVLQRVPGRKLLVQLPESPIRALVAIDTWRFYAVAGNGFYQVFLDGTYQKRGVVEPGGFPAQIIGNDHQLLVMSNTQAYLDDGTDPTIGPFNNFTPVVPATSIAFMDSYFIAQQPNSNQFNLSGVDDGTSWDPLDFGVKEGGPDRLVRVFAKDQRTWLFGEFTSEPWWDSGGAAGVGGAGVALPFQRVDGGLIKVGCGAPFSVADLPDSMCFLSLAPEGGGTIWRLYSSGQFNKISNLAIDAQIPPFADDAVAYTALINGHWFYHIDFPTQGLTFVYDATSSEKLGTPVWTKWQLWDSNYGVYRSDRARFHCSVLGNHVVGGGDATGNLYLQSSQYNDDAGVPIRRRRTSPHVNDEANYMFYHRFQLDMNVGNAPTPGTTPVITLRISRDGGYTWGNEKQISVGQTGDFSYRARVRRLGRARDAVFETVMTDPYNETLVDAYLHVGREQGSKELDSVD